jgi:hypothetical protein
MTEQPDLFAGIPAMKSPRLRWIEAHGIKTEIKATSQWSSWFAWIGESETIRTTSVFANGITEDDALFALAKKCNLRMWNEL